MWLTVGRPGRSRRLAALCVATVLSGLFAGCLGAGDGTSATVVPVLDEEPPWQVRIGAETGDEDDTLLIQGDRMVDRLARQMGWNGKGSFAEPYRAVGLALEGKTLAFADTTRAVELHEARLTAPADAPALLLRNVTAFTVSSSVLTATTGHAIHVVASEWVRIGSSALYGDGDGVVAEDSASLDLIENDIRVGQRAFHLRDGDGNHWIEGNRIHEATTGILLVGNARPSVVLGNQITARTGILSSDSAGPLVESNEIRADEAVVLQRSPDSALIENVIAAGSTGVWAEDSPGLFAEATEIQTEGSGFRLRDSDLTLIARLDYTGPGPAVSAEGGDLLLLTNSTLALSQGEGDAIVLEDTTQSILISNEVSGGGRHIVLSRTEEATVARNVLVGAARSAMELADTRASLIVENEVYVTPVGVQVTGGQTPQIASNRFDTIVATNGSFATGIQISDATGAEVSFNDFENTPAAVAMHIVRAPEVLIDHNDVPQSRAALRLEGSPGATVLDNRFEASGLMILGPAAEARLLIQGNRLSGATTAAITLEGLDGFVMRDNWLSYNQVGLRLHDVVGGTVYNNYFDNGGVNAAATGRLDVAWHVDPQAGPNIAGGESIGGNWWHDYSGVDADEDGFGDLPHGVLPYRDDASIALSQATNYGVQDEAPLTKSSIADEPANAQRVPSDLLGPRLDRAKDHSVRLDAFLQDLA